MAITPPRRRPCASPSSSNCLARRLFNCLLKDERGCARRPRGAYGSRRSAHHRASNNTSAFSTPASHRRPGQSEAVRCLVLAGELQLFDCRATYVEAPRPGAAAPAVRLTLPDGEVVTSEQGDLNRRLSRALRREVTLDAAERVQREAFGPEAPPEHRATILLCSHRLAPFPLADRVVVVE